MNRDRAAAIVAHNLALEAELGRVQDALEAAEIQMITLKGVPLLRRIGAPLGERALADNDVLVRTRDVTRAVAALGRLGYEPAAHEPDGDGSHRVLLRTVGAKRMMTELHWDAFHPPFAGVDEDLIWSRTEPVAYQGRTLTVFDRPLTLVHTAAHFVWHELRQIRILETLGREWTAWGGAIDLTDLHALAKRTGTYHALAYCLRASEDLGLTTGAPRLASWRARLLLRLLPAGELPRRRPHPDHRRILLSHLLLPVERAGLHLARLASPRTGRGRRG